MLQFAGETMEACNSPKENCLLQFHDSQHAVQSRSLNFGMMHLIQNKKDSDLDLY